MTERVEQVKISYGSENRKRKAKRKEEFQKTIKLINIDKYVTTKNLDCFELEGDSTSQGQIDRHDGSQTSQATVEMTVDA